MADLPNWLAAAVEAHLAGRSRADLAARSSRISTAYRGGTASSAVVREAGDALAYAVARMPATYAAAAHVFAEIAALLPDFAPASLCDAGAGPGTAGFAAAECWPGLRRLVQVDHNPAFLALARDLGGAAPAGASPLALDQIRAELPKLKEELGRFDLVVLAYVLAEFDLAAAGALAARLWRAETGRLLVLIEPGTPEGYRRILAVRDRLIGEGARILAPCPHEAACPLVAPDWCHFAERLPRRRAHMAAKGAALPFEDEKFSYLVALREAAPPAREARILAPPEMTKPALRFKLCRPDGTAGPETVPRRDKPRFALARRLDWGDRLEGEAAGEVL
ncbi:hypothetical protein GCM10011390_44820 [Aureimonas endophytica]|uniref:Small ribosomal subunit Rsm22 n=1 Tax=Aureimonas endophytica TaxID=2027858 RepID=A0A917A009_9HYPH|nr:small ribosomal subunit Rsm22 family protein [Aureimonas endophytica]GGE20557.1 hypothetical protein GCM10011390_44820 [Aureimonas endophytica]